MKLDDFNLLTDEEKANYLNSMETAQKNIDDLTAERNSFKAENENLSKQVENSTKELKATKELNFTLARKINTGEPVDPEQALFDFMKGIRNNGH